MTGTPIILGSGNYVFKEGMIETLPNGNKQLLVGGAGGAKATPAAPTRTNGSQPPRARNRPGRPAKTAGSA